MTTRVGVNHAREAVVRAMGNGLEGIQEPKVSFVTPTTHSRLKFMQTAMQCVYNQHFEYIGTTMTFRPYEWIIVVGDTDNNIKQDFYDKMCNIISRGDANDFSFKIRFVFFRGVNDTFEVNSTYEQVRRDCCEWTPEVFVHYVTDCCGEETVPLGRMRNVYNELAVGDIIKCHDDDDFYPPESTQHAVDTLKSSGLFLAGVSCVYFYESRLREIYKYTNFVQYKSPNSALAYTRKYLSSYATPNVNRVVTAKYDDGAAYAEEVAFTDNFNEPLAQLDPLKTVLLMSHSTNTANKYNQIILNYAMINDDSKRVIVKTDFKLEHFIHDSALLRTFRQTLHPDVLEPSEYDIVWHCGLSSPWSPTQQDLGGSEQAVKHLSEQWVRDGKRVAVYTTLKNPQCERCAKYQASNAVQVTDWIKNARSCKLCWRANRDKEYPVVLDGVHYYHFSDFHLNRQYNTVILWRKYGMVPLLNYDIQCKRLLVDLHDTTTDAQLICDNIHKISRICVKSEWHRDAVLYQVSKIRPQMIIGVREKMFVHVNGIRAEIPKLLSRYPERTLLSKDAHVQLLYCSCYTRGLREILLYFWPKFHDLYPQSTLHICYGMELVQDEAFKREMEFLFRQPGVKEYGKLTLDRVIELKCKCHYHYYFTETQAETDCISIRESAYCGCTPVLNSKGVFLERTGILLEGNSKSEEDQHKCARILVERIKSLRSGSSCQTMNTVISDHRATDFVFWNEVASVWLDIV